MRRDDTPWWSAERRHQPLGAGRRSAPLTLGKRKGRPKGGPAPSRTGRRSVGSAGYLTIESDLGGSPDERVSAKSGAAYPRNKSHPGFPPHLVRGHPGNNPLLRRIYARNTAMGAARAAAFSASRMPAITVR